MDSVGVGWVERKGDHGLLLGEVDADHRVVVGDLTRLEFLVGLRTLVHPVVLLNLLVGNPDRAETGGLGGHHVDSVTEVGRKESHARAGELKHLVLHETVLEHGLDEGDGHIMRADSLLRLAFEPNQHNLRSVDVPSVVEELLHKLAAAFADTHAAERTVARVAVGTEDHAAATGESLADILMNNCLIGRNIDTTVLLGGGEAEDMVVLVDGTTDSAQRVVAVGHRVRDRELVKSAGAGCLDNSDISDVV